MSSPYSAAGRRTESVHIKRVLLVPDGFGAAYSGHALAVFVAQILVEMEISVGVFSETGKEAADSLGTVFYQCRPKGETSKDSSGIVDCGFSNAVDDFNPTHLFVVGAAINKDPRIFSLAIHRGIKIVTLWLVQDYYCVKNWAVLSGEPCSKCAGGNFLYSILHNCVPFSVGPQSCLKKRKTQVGGIMRRTWLRKLLLRSDKVIGTGKHQLDMYKKFGYRADQLIDCPFFYDRNRVPQIESSRGDYFVFLGQHSEAKGWTLLSQIMDRCPTQVFVGLLMPSISYDQTVKTFGFDKHIESGQLRLIIDVTWGAGAEKYVAESAGVVNPSLWQSTTETVLLESLGLGKPVVVFNVGVHRDYFEDGVNGCMARLGDVQGYADRVNWLASVDNSRYQGIVDKALDLFETLVDKQRYFDALERALE